MLVRHVLSVCAFVGDFRNKIAHQTLTSRDDNDSLILVTVQRQDAFGNVNAGARLSHTHFVKEQHLVEIAVNIAKERRQKRLMFEQISRLLDTLKLFVHVVGQDVSFQEINVLHLLLFPSSARKS
jgi:hypothetical protein